MVGILIMVLFFFIKMPCFLHAISGKNGKRASNHFGSLEETWQSFFASPVEWWDNRKNKVLMFIQIVIVNDKILFYVYALHCS